MADDVVEKISVTPKPPPVVCTVLADGSLTVHQDNIPMLELQRLILHAASLVSERMLARAASMERVLLAIDTRYGGFAEDIERGIRASLNPPRPPAPGPVREPEVLDAAG